MSTKATYFEYRIGQRVYKLIVTAGLAELIQLPVQTDPPADPPPAPVELANGPSRKVLARVAGLIREAMEKGEEWAVTKLKANKEREAGTPLPTLPDSHTLKLYTVEIFGSPAETYAQRDTLNGHGYFYPKEKRGLWRKCNVPAKKLRAEQKLAATLGFEFSYEETGEEQPAPPIPGEPTP